MGVTQSTQHSHVLETKRGRLEGVERRDLSGRPILRQYLKVPYAHPPVGALRWRRPQPLSSDFTFDQQGNPGDYTKFGPICPQPEYNTGAALVDNPNAAPEIENIQSEDCLYLNIFVPVGEPPSQGWPVQFFIHGGWMQIGDAMQSNDYDPFDLLANSTQRVIVSATHRLNIFGFAAGADLASTNPDPFPGNYGLWDQRLALEWTYTNIGLFGGNPELISVGGLSAGAHATFMQLYYDTYLPIEQQIIKQIFLYSNARAIQPDSATSSTLTSQFDEICDVLAIPTSLPAKDKVDKARATRWQDVVATIPKLKQHTFRTSTDGPIENGGFCPPTFLSSLYDGSFATRIAERGSRIMLGEVRDEALLYKLVNPPSDYNGLITQLCNYYPRHVTDALVALPLYNVPKPDDPSATAEQWTNVFAEIVADVQVHASVRGLTKSLLDPPRKEGVKAVPRENVFRYKICWRAKCIDDWIKPECGLCHASDTPIWWASGFRMGFNEKDKEICLKFIDEFGRFLEGKKITEGDSQGQVDELRLLDENGEIHQSWKDENWERGIEIWNTVMESQKDVLNGA